MISDRGSASPAGTARTAEGRLSAMPLLVMAVLCGLLAMHGLGPTPPDAGRHHPDKSRSAAAHATSPDASGHRAPAHAGGHARPTAADGAAAAGSGEGTHGGTATRHRPGSPAPHGNQPAQYTDECQCGGGHPQHADPACAASGTSGTPSVDGPATAASPGPQPPGHRTGRWVHSGGERAPPCLHRLQLLRI